MRGLSSPSDAQVYVLVSFLVLFFVAAQNLICFKGGPLQDLLERILQLTGPRTAAAAAGGLMDGQLQPRLGVEGGIEGVEPSLGLYSDASEISRGLLIDALRGLSCQSQLQAPRGSDGTAALFEAPVTTSRADDEAGDGGEAAGIGAAPSCCGAYLEDLRVRLQSHLSSGSTTSTTAAAAACSAIFRDQSSSLNLATALLILGFWLLWNTVAVGPQNMSWVKRPEGQDICCVLCRSEPSLCNDS